MRFDSLLERVVRLVLIGSIVTGGFVAVSVAGARSQSNATGTIAGVIESDSGSSFEGNLAEVPARMKIVATTPDGAAVGTLVFGRVRHDAAGAAELPYTIEHVPFGVPLHVSARPSLATPQAPIPTGFFITFRLEKSRGDGTTPDYTATLGSEHARIDDCDFTYRTIEVPPALPVPSPSPSAT